MNLVDRPTIEASKNMPKLTPLKPAVKVTILYGIGVRAAVKTANAALSENFALKLSKLSRKCKLSTSQLPIDSKSAQPIKYPTIPPKILKPAVSSE